MSMARLWQYAFWGEKPATPAAYPILARRRSQWLILSPIAVLITLSLSIGLFTEPFFQLSRMAAEQVMDRQGYIDAVNLSADIVINPVAGAAQSTDSHAP
jgi:multicomponent Na+:H+ antiporter subunit D